MFVGTGAPRGKDLDLPGRKEAAANIHIGIEWLEGVAFEHIKTIGEKVLIIGVGNTAMDCCRTSARLGGKDVKVMARRSRQFFKASPWELEDAEEEQIEIVVNHAPKRFVVEGGKLRGMEFERLEWSKDAAGKDVSRVIETVFIPADDVILAIGQENAFPWIERDLRHGVRQVGHAGGRQGHPAVDGAGGLLRRRRGLWSEEHHLGGGARPRGRHLHRQPLPRRARQRAAGRGDEPDHPEDGAVRVELQQRLQPRPPRQDETRRPARAVRAS